MINSIYFASEREIITGTRSVALGFGFTPEGRWRGGLPEAEVLAVDDLCLPSPAGLREAVELLRGWKGSIVFDFERPPAAGLLRLLEALKGCDAAVPPAYALAPHSRVFVGPYGPGQGFCRWLAQARKRYGPLVLDGAPIRCRIFPGKKAEPYGGPLPERSLPCPGCFCLQSRSDDGAVLLWDTRQTLAARCAAAGSPVIVLQAEWDRLPE